MLSLSFFFNYNLNKGCYQNTFLNSIKQLRMFPHVVFSLVIYDSREYNIQSDFLGDENRSLTIGVWQLMNLFTHNIVKSYREIIYIFPIFGWINGNVKNDNKIQELWNCKSCFDREV